MLRLPRPLAAAALAVLLAQPLPASQPPVVAGPGAIPGATLTREALNLLPLRTSVEAALAVVPGSRPVEAWTMDGIGLPIEGCADWLAAIDWRHLEQIEVRRSAADASSPGAATRLTLVTRGGASAFAGAASLDFTSRRLQSHNVPPVLARQGAESGTPIRLETDTDLEAGGPLLRRRAWWWAAAARSYREAGIIGFHQLDVTTLTTAGARLQAQWPGGSRTSLSVSHTDRRKPSRGASAYDRFEATTRQSGLGVAQPLRLQHAWAASDALALDAAVTATDAGLLLDFQAPSLAGVQPAYDRYTLVNWRSAARSKQARRALHATASATVAHERGGRSVSARAGTEWLSSSDHRLDHTGGGAVAIFDSRTGTTIPWQARLLRDGSTGHRERRIAAFVEGSIRAGRVALDSGLRFDRQDDEALEATIPANAVLPDLLPPVRFAGADSGVVFADFSPRAALRFDADGRAGTIVKASAARYRATGNDTSRLLQPTGQTRLVYWWNDADADSFVQADELDLARGLAGTPSSNYDPATPAAVRTPAAVDSALASVITDEVSLGIERQLARHLAVRVAYVGRKIHRMRSSYPVEADGTPVASDTYLPVTWAPAACVPGAKCPAVTFYERAQRLPRTTILRNDGRYAWRHGLDVSLHRRLSAGWMLDLAIAWNRSSMHVPRPTADYTDPTNVAAWNGTAHSMPEPAWEAALTASVRLPAGLRTSAVLGARSGLPYDRAVASPNRGALGPADVSIARYGSERYPDVLLLDWRLEWVRRAGPLRIAPALDLFNALNSGVVLARNRIQNSASANRVTDLVAPRLLRLHLRVSW
jgi:hypothetical protein